MRNPFDTIAETDESWPYEDAQTFVDFNSHEMDNPYEDIDLLERKADPRVFSLLTDDEYSVVSRRFGLNTQSESMKDIASDLGFTHAQTREILGCALSKLKAKLLSEVD